MDTCRCGHSNDAVIPHPCHWQAPGGRCNAPATQRFYDPRSPNTYAGVAGVQMKLSVSDTWACDEHWEVFKGMLAARHAVKATPKRG